MQHAKLSDKVILVKLTQRRAPLTKRDKALTNQLQTQYNDNSLTAIYKLFRDLNSPINKLMKKHNEVYAYHKQNTIPHIDAGPRMLPSTLYFEYAQEMKQRVAVVEKLADQCYQDYDQIVSDDIMFRNSGYASGRANRDEYPTAEQFRNAVGSDLRFTPMPDKRHFLFDLSEEDLAEFDRAEAELASMAREDTINRMLKPLSDLTRRLGEYQGNKGERFHNSLMENVLEGCTTARKLAIDPSPELVQEINAIEQLASSYLQNVEIIKGSANARVEARKKLDEATERLSAYNF
jgi:hypothetical protein